MEIRDTILTGPSDIKVILHSDGTVVVAIGRLIIKQLNYINTLEDTGKGIDNKADFQLVYDYLKKVGFKE